MPLPKITQDRIKQDATIATDKRYPEDAENFEYLEYEVGYIAGATAEHEIIEPIIEALKICRYALQICYDVTQHPGDGTSAQDKAIEVAEKALQQWKEGEPTDPCPHCGKELSRDRNLCCRECGTEVITPDQAATLLHPPDDNSPKGPEEELFTIKNGMGDESYSRNFKAEEVQLMLIDFALAYHKSTNKDIANDASEYIHDILTNPQK